nr:MAG: hypothetical protein [Bacteriophage sp.]
MLTNSDCTFYEKGSYTKHSVAGVYWNDSKGQTISKNGVQISDSVTVYLYSDEYIPKAGDIILRGNTDFQFDVSSQQSEGESMKLFRAAFPDFAVVKSVNNCMFGGLPHIEVVAR